MDRDAERPLSLAPGLALRLVTHDEIVDGVVHDLLSASTLVSAVDQTETGAHLRRATHLSAVAPGATSARHASASALAGPPERRVVSSPTGDFCGRATAHSSWSISCHPHLLFRRTRSRAA